MCQTRLMDVNTRIGIISPHRYIHPFTLLMWYENMVEDVYAATYFYINDVYVVRPKLP